MSWMVEEYERDGFTVKIHGEEDGELFNPRQWDNLSTMVCWHPDYTLGDYQLKDADGRGAVENHYEPDGRGNGFTSMRHLYRYLRFLAVEGVVLPLYLYDHSGISMSAGAPNPFDNPRVRGDHHGNGLGWDTSMVGYVFATAEDIAKCMGDDAKMTADDIEAALRSDVETYNQWLVGDIYWYTVEHRGECVGSCGGIFGFEEAKKEADAVIDGELAARAKAAAQGMHQWDYVRKMVGVSA